MAGEEVKDFCDRRSGIERRRFTYTLHIPERRVTKEMKIAEKPQKRSSPATDRFRGLP